MSDVTVLVPARDASATIERAVRSAVAQRPAAIALIDRSSRDETVTLARGASGRLLQVLAAPVDATPGRVRQIGLDAVTTEFGMWLDAGDELLPGRAERLVRRLQADHADLAFDEIDLHDGETGSFIRRREIPPFLGGRRQIVRLFERNYLPGPGVPAFRTAAARQIGFDPALRGAEDFDFVLRSIAQEKRISLIRQVGYREFAMPSSRSRDMENQFAMMREALRQHSPAAVRELFESAGFHERTTAWGMVAFLTLRGDLAHALSWAEKLPGGSRREFHRGTLLAALGRHAEALGPLQQAYDEAGVPELLNNFGVVLAALGRTVEANSRFADALREFPGYADASANLLAEQPARLTLLPLRRDCPRNE